MSDRNRAVHGGLLGACPPTGTFALSCPLLLSRYMYIFVNLASARGYSLDGPSAPASNGFFLFFLPFLSFFFFLLPAPLCCFAGVSSLTFAGRDAGFSALCFTRACVRTRPGFCFFSVRCSILLFLSHTIPSPWERGHLCTPWSISALLHSFFSGILSCRATRYDVRSLGFFHSTPLPLLVPRS